MKIKKLLSLLLAAVILASTIISCNYAFADKANISAKTNNAWLSDIYIRESSADCVKNPIQPDLTGFEVDETSFRKEVSIAKDLININSSNLEDVYIDILNKAFGILDSIANEVDYNVMKAYLQTEWKIIYSETPGASDAMYTTILYACLKYDLMYPVKGHHFAVPANTTLDRAMVLLISALLDDEVDESIATLQDYAILNIKRSLVKNGYLESVNDELTDEELLILYKIMIAESQDFPISNKNVSTMTEEEKFFVHSSYAAAVIKMNFDIKISPKRVGEALKSENPDALEILILTAKIEAKKGTVTGNETVGQLLSKASALKAFRFENKFYSDIYNYNVYLLYNCQEIWVTPFLFAAELGDDKLKNVQVKINGEKAQHSRSSKVKIDGKVTKMVVEIKYNDKSVKDTAKYTFNIYNGARELPSIKAPTPQPPERDTSYSGPNLIKPDRPNSKFELKDPNSFIVDPFKVGLGGGHSLPPFISSLLPDKDNKENSSDSSSQKDVKDAQKTTPLSKEQIVIIASAAAIVILIIALVLAILKKKGVISFEKISQSIKEKKKFKRK